MSAVPGEFMNAPLEPRKPSKEHEEKPADSFWGWFALGMLLFCWIAEASMCAMRGF